MSRIENCFNSLKAQGRCALVPYIAAGDPVPRITVPLMHALVASGADIIELGVPFSDPMADGPVIQRAAERALQHHVSLAQVLAMVREFRVQDRNTPVILMGYLNPIEVMGYARFAEAAAAAGVDGALTVDLPPEEADELRLAWLQYTLERPFNVWTLLPSMGIRRVALFGGEGWGLALHRQLASAGVRCVAVIDNNASTRQAAMVPARYFSLPEYLAKGPAAQVVLSSLQGDHDRDVLSALQEELGPAVPVLSWKMLFSLLAEQPADAKDTSLLACKE